MADLNLKATISAQDDTKAAFSSLNSSLNSVKEATDKAQSSTKSFADQAHTVGSSLTTVGKTMTTDVSLPIAAGFALAVKSSMDFSQSMLELQTQAGDTTTGVADLSKKLMAMAGQFEQTPAEMAKALFPIESSGYRGAQALDVLTNSAKLASLGQTDLTQTADAVTTVMKAMPNSVKTSSDAVSLMNAIIGNGKMHLDDLNQAMGTGFLSTANTFGVSLQSVGAGLAFMTNAGIPATDAATKLKMAITLLGAPSTEQVKLLGAIGVGMDDAKARTKDMSDALSKAGVTQSQLADDLKKPNGLAVAIQDLKDHLEKSGVSSVAAADIIAKSFGGGRTGTAIMQMVNDTNGLKDTFDAVGKSAGDFNDSVIKQGESPTAKLKESYAALNGALINLGNTLTPILLPAIVKLTDELTKLSDGWSKLSPHTQDFILASLGILAALGPVLGLIGNITKAAGLLSTGFDVAKVGVKGVASAMGDYLGAAKSTSASFLDTATQATTNAATAAAAWVSAAATTIKQWVTVAAEAVVNAVKSAAAWVSSAATAVAQWAIAAAQTIAAWVMMGVQAVKNALIASAAWIKSAAASEDGLIISAIKVVASYVGMALQAGLSAVQAAGAWVLSAAQTAGAWIAALPGIIGTYVAMAAQAVISAAQTAGAWVLSAAQAIAAWIAALPQMILTFVSTAASAVAQAVIAAGAWVVSSTVSAAAWVAQSLKIIAQFIAMGATAVAQGIITTAVFVASAAKAVLLAVAIEGVKFATGVWTAAQWLLNAAMDANPIGLIALAITALIGLIYLLITHWHQVTDAIKEAWTWFKNLNPVIQTLISPMLAVASGIEKIVSNWGKIKSTIGNDWSKVAGALGFKAEGGPVSGGEAYIVGEKGPELFIPSQSGSIIPNNKLSAAGDTNITINFHGDIMNTSNQNLDDIGRRLGKNIVQAIQGQAV